MRCFFSYHYFLPKLSEIRINTFPYAQRKTDAVKANYLSLFNFMSNCSKLQYQFPTQSSLPKSIFSLLERNNYLIIIVILSFSSHRLMLEETHYVAVTYDICIYMHCKMARF